MMLFQFEGDPKCKQNAWDDTVGWQKDKNKVILGSLKDNITIWLSTYDFPFTLCKSYASVLHCFWDIASYLLKNTFFQSHVSLATPNRMTSLEFQQDIWYQKLAACPDCQYFLLEAAKSALTHWKENSRSISSKNRHSIGDWCKQSKNVGKQEVN